MPRYFLVQAGPKAVSLPDFQVMESPATGGPVAWTCSSGFHPRLPRDFNVITRENGVWRTYHCLGSGEAIQGTAPPARDLVRAAEFALREALRQPWTDPPAWPEAPGWTGPQSFVQRSSPLIPGGVKEDHVRASVDGQPIRALELHALHQRDPFPGGHRYTLLVRQPAVVEVVRHQFARGLHRAVPEHRQQTVLNLIILTINYAHRQRDQSSLRPGYFANNLERLEVRDDSICAEGVCSPVVPAKSAGEGG